jgi:protein gp37
MNFHADRLFDPDKIKNPAYIFVGSMSDIGYWKKEWTLSVINVCKENPQHTFMFLSKCGESYDGFKWSNNTILGMTIEQAGLHRTLDIIDFACNHRTFLSVEPVLGTITGGHKTYENFEYVIVGAMTGPKAISPKPEWIQSIRDNVPAEKIYWKANIKPFLEGK